ncbi:AbrB/MazE/SpoVT family DNA-binding domain-containing protein [Roseateles sp. MS654]|uniref:AbrB/MazE/SpoVT family DNA-binding domain-containing protein n=1 Tax=Roseateles sp. MS654 TaxID=3412685 RepID=UPI003C2F9A80
MDICHRCKAGVPARTPFKAVAVGELAEKNLRLSTTFHAGTAMPAPVAKISPRHRIELPKEIRDSLDWRAGQQLMLIRQDDGVFICPLVTLKEVRGIAKGANTEGYRDRDDRY